jgi:hypothetical protein
MRHSGISISAQHYACLECLTSPPYAACWGTYTFSVCLSLQALAVFYALHTLAAHWLLQVKTTDAGNGKTPAEVTTEKFGLEAGLYQVQHSSPSAAISMASFVLKLSVLHCFAPWHCFVPMSLMTHEPC